MEVELGLRHRLEQPSTGCPRRVAGMRCRSGVGHRPMLRFRRLDRGTIPRAPATRTPFRPCHPPRLDHLEDSAGSASSTLSGREVSHIVWLLAAALIALGAAGVVAGMDTPVAGRHRPHRSDGPRRRDRERLPRQPSRPICARSRTTSPRSASRRASILASMASNETDTVDAATAQGTQLVADIKARTERDPRARLDQVPIVGTPAADLRAVARHRRSPCGVPRRAHVDRVDWMPPGRRSRSARCARTDCPDSSRPRSGRRRRGRRRSKGRVPDALGHLDDADTAIADAREAARPAEGDGRRRRRSTNGSTEASATTSPFGRCTWPVQRGASTEADPRRRCEKEQAAKDRLPPDTRSLVLIMADIGQGGINDAADRHRAGAQRPRRGPRAAGRRGALRLPVRLARAGAR